MIVVLSGEGASDLGQCTNNQSECSIPEFSPGPMTVIADKAIAMSLEYSPLELTPDRYIYLGEEKLKELNGIRKSRSRGMSLVGKGRDQETGYFHVNAWVLGLAALGCEANFPGDKAIAIMFRDADGTRSNVKGLWEAKLKSMHTGFQRSGLGERGVPMIPKPKSEVWMLCAAKSVPYQNCAKLEGLSGNDNSPKSAKSKLSQALAGCDSAIEQRQWVEDNDFDIQAVASQMSSFAQFVGDLRKAIDLTL